ncbi:MAG TPA: hypothetical protein VK274_06710 [Pyrinomonadaceae bacterium]|nr:hypothetical protein [Pyrinomonadaceae bacterium]
MSDDDVFEIQRLYPQIYIACHTDHVRALLARAARKLNEKGRP